jgi:hypothetical protein
MIGLALWFVLLLATALLVVAAGLRRVAVLDALVIAFSIVVLACLALGTVSALHPAGMLLLIAFVAAGAGWLAWRRWKMHGLLSKDPYAEQQEHLVMTAIPMLAAIAVSILLLIHIWIQIQWQPLNADSLSYHVPRAYFWIEQGRISPLETGDFRWDEFPVNGSILVVWTMLAGSFPVAAWLPQWMGVLLIAAGCFFLVREIGGRPGTAFCAMAGSLAMPSVFVQSATASNDLLVAGLGIAAAVYLVRIWRSLSAGGRASTADVLLFAAAVGLGCGTKFTFGLFAPAGLIGAGLIVWNARRAMGGNLRVAGAQLAASVLLIGFLGAGTYVQNVVSYGDPFQSEASRKIIDALSVANDAPFTTQAFMSIYESASLDGFEPVAPQLLDQRVEVAKSVADSLGIPFSDVPMFQQVDHLRKPVLDFGSAGHGLTAALSMLITFFAFAGFAVHAVLSRSARSCMIALLAFAALSAFVGFNLSKAWTPSHSRYLVTFVPFCFVVAALAFESLGKLRILPIGLYAAYGVWVSLWCAWDAPDRLRERQLVSIGLQEIDVKFGGVMGSYVEAVRASAEPTIEVFGRIDSWGWLPVYFAPELHYALGRGEPGAAQDGRLVIVDRPGFRSSQAVPAGTFNEGSGPFLVSTRIADIVRGNQRTFGVRISDDGEMLMSGIAMKAISGIGSLGSVGREDTIHWSLPAGLVSTGKGEEILAAFEVKSTLALTETLTHVLCDGEKVAFNVKSLEADKSVLTFSVPSVQSGVAAKCSMHFNQPVIFAVGRAADVNFLPPLSLQVATGRPPAPLPATGTE